MKTILVVEDNENNQLVIEDMFRKHRKEYALRFFSTGQGLLSFLDTDAADLILLDMRLPDISGWDLASRLKNNAATSNIPVIAVTAHAMKGDEEKALKAGCDDFVTKPVNRQELLEKVKKWESR
ncbi:MAG: response regulator [SAR324 cluster bacterium]|nr:response regulator [SAR324 cluster bacterium]